MTKAVIDDGGSWRARICFASVTSTSTSPYIGVIRRPARSATVTSRRLEGNGWVCTRRGRPAFITPPWPPARRAHEGRSPPDRGPNVRGRGRGAERRRRWGRRRLVVPGEGGAAGRQRRLRGAQTFLA